MQHCACSTAKSALRVHSVHSVHSVHIVYPGVPARARSPRTPSARASGGQHGPPCQTRTLTLEEYLLHCLSGSTTLYLTWTLGRRSSLTWWSTPRCCSWSDRDRLLSRVTLPKEMIDVYFLKAVIKVINEIMYLYLFDWVKVHNLE